MGASGKSQVVGYEYYMGVQLALVHGPIDAVTRLTADDREVWAGNVTGNQTIAINQPNLFGGKSREGGWVGQIDIMMGADDQEKNPYLLSKLGNAIPAYRGLVTTVFRGKGAGGFMWSMMNPYFKAPVWEIYRAINGWSRPVWYPERAKIGPKDVNAAHIVYEALTDLKWGMGYSPADIDETSFRACADKLYAENFGLSLLWMEQTSINDFLQMVLNHVDGALRVDLSTGKFVLRLIRNDYDIATLPELKPSNILELSSYQRVAWGDTANEVVVKFTDRNQEDVTITLHDLASIEAQGRVISTTREYPGIREGDLASRVGSRDLNNVSTPLAKVTLKCNRVAWDWDLTDVFRLNWPRLGIVNAPFRIVKINKGNITNNEIEIEALEDIFGLPANSYADVQPPTWVNPVQKPAPVAVSKVFEAPYYDVIQAYTAADIDYFDTDYAFGELAAVQPSSATFGYELWGSPNNNVYTDLTSGEFTPTGTIDVAIQRGATPITIGINNPVNIDTDLVGEYCYIDNEAFQIVAVNMSSLVRPTVTLARGVIDTLPAAHAAGSRVWFADNSMGYDPTQRTSGETIYYKPLTRTGQGTLDLAQAAPVGYTFFGRAQRPYPPGNLQVNGQYWPAQINGDLTVSWAHRDRIQQTAGLIPFQTGSIGPEAGTTYTVKVMRPDGTLVRTYTGITGTSWTYPASDVILDGNLMDVRLQVFSVRDSLQSWQIHDLIVQRPDLMTTGFGLDFGNNFGGAHG